MDRASINSIGYRQNICWKDWKTSYPLSEGLVTQLGCRTHFRCWKHETIDWTKTLSSGKYLHKNVYCQYSRHALIYCWKEHNPCMKNSASRSNANNQFTKSVIVSKFRRQKLTSSVTYQHQSYNCALLQLHPYKTSVPLEKSDIMLRIHQPQKEDPEFY